MAKDDSGIGGAAHLALTPGDVHRLARGEASDADLMNPGKARALALVLMDYARKWEAFEALKAEGARA